MRFLVPLSLAILLAACAAPEDKETKHQRELWEQARANYIALGGRVHSEATPTPAPHLVEFQTFQAAAPTPRPRYAAQMNPPPPPAATPRPRAKFTAQVNPPPRRAPKTVPQAAPQPPPPSRVARNQEDTVYYWQVGAPPRENSARFAVAEAKYARILAKRPENLTPEEKIWAHEHY